MTEPTLPVSQPKRLVSHEQARAAYIRIHDALYDNKPAPCLSVPPQPDDVDMILCDYIEQQAERDRELQQVKEWKHNALVAMDADKEVIDRLIWRKTVQTQRISRNLTF